MKFTECDLLVNEKNITSLDIFKNIEEDKFPYEDTEYIVNCEVIDQNIFWLYARFGKTNPYSNEIINRDTRETGENPKQKNQIELNKQLFCAYVMKDNILYISDFRKQNFLSSYLKQRFNQEFLIKKYFIEPKEFTDTITSIGKISFTSKQNIFTGDIFTEIEDTLGYGSTECFTFEAKINKASIFDSVKCLNLLENLKRRRDNQQIEKMICIGKNDEGVESIFNLDNYLKKIDLNLEQDENGRYDSQKIKNAFLQKIYSLEK